MRIVGETPDESIKETSNVADKHSYRRTCTLSKPMIELLVKQMGVELSNHNLYVTFANYYKFEGLTKLREYFKRRADEELLHFNWIKKYLNFSDALYTVPEIERVDVEIKDRVYPFEATVDREIQTTVDIFKIMDAAIKEGDYFTINWLYGGSPLDGKLVPEQLEEEALSREVLKIAKIAGNDWLDIQDAVMEYYISTR